MKVEIRRGPMEHVIIITFHTKPDAFESDYDRSKFFRSLHGWQQSVSKNDKKYTYHRPGLLDEVPHVKIADSVFMTAMEHMKQVEKFFDEWEKKVRLDMMEVMMSKNEFEEMKKRHLHEQRFL